MKNKSEFISIAKYITALYTLIFLPLGGLAFFGYIFYTNKKISDLEDQLDAALNTNNKDEIFPGGVEGIEEVEGSCSNFEIYKECIIENYQDKFYRIMKPGGEYISKIFLNQEDAKKEIDLAQPISIVKHERSKIHNIRFVK